MLKIFQEFSNAKHQMSDTDIPTPSLNTNMQSILLFDAMEFE